MDNGGGERQGGSRLKQRGRFINKRPQARQAGEALDGRAARSKASVLLDGWPGRGLESPAGGRSGLWRPGEFRTGLSSDEVRQSRPPWVTANPSLEG